MALPDACLMPVGCCIDVAASKPHVSEADDSMNCNHKFSRGWRRRIWWKQQAAFWQPFPSPPIGINLFSGEILERATIDMKFSVYHWSLRKSHACLRLHNFESQTA